MIPGLSPAQHSPRLAQCNYTEDQPPPLPYLRILAWDRTGVGAGPVAGKWRFLDEVYVVAGRTRRHLLPRRGRLYQAIRSRVKLLPVFGNIPTAWRHDPASATGPPPPGPGHQPAARPRSPARCPVPPAAWPPPAPRQDDFSKQEIVPAVTNYQSPLQRRHLAGIDRKESISGGAHYIDIHARIEL